MGGLIFVGLGLSGLHDITLRGLDALRSADTVVAEFYTSRMMGAEVRDIEGLVGKPIRVLRREDVEVHADQILREAQTKLVAFLVPGDAMTATTHQDLRQRALELRIPVRYIPGISVFTVAPAAAGLQVYKFGRTVTVPFWEEKFQPDSFYDAIRDNKTRGLHSLILLDIQADRERFMRAHEAVAILRTVEERRGEGVITPDTVIIGLARVGSSDERVLAAPASEWDRIDLGPPLHCLILPGSLHFMEESALARLRQPRA